MIDYSSLFPDLQPEAKAWAYVSDRRLTVQEKTALEDTIDSFRAQWSSHGRLVLSNYTLLDDQILIISAEVKQGDISGCGIDKSLHLLNDVAQKGHYEWVNSLSIVFRENDGALRVASRNEFKTLAKAEQVTSNTRVFDFSIGQLRDIRSGHFELPAGASWHQRVFKMPTVQQASSF